MTEFVHNLRRFAMQADRPTRNALRRMSLENGYYGWIADIVGCAVWEKTCDVCGETIQRGKDWEKWLACYNCKRERKRRFHIVGPIRPGEESQNERTLHCKRCEILLEYGGGDGYHCDECLAALGKEL